MVSDFANEIIMRLELFYGLQQLMKVAFYLLNISFLFVDNISSIRKNCGLPKINLDDSRAIFYAVQKKIRNRFEQSKSFTTMLWWQKLSTKLIAWLLLEEINIFLSEIWE